MPTYVYECLECKNRFEVFHSMSEEPVKECEKCGRPVRKVFNSTGVIFKGSGFYVNDYKAKGERANTENQPACQGCSGCASGRTE